MLGNGNGNKKIVQDLDKLAELYDALARAAAERQAQVDSVLQAAGVLASLAEIDTEHLPRIENVQGQIKTLVEKIKAAVEKYGETVEGSALQGVYTKGRVSWNDDALRGYALDHPDVLQFRTVGNPSAKVVPVAKKK